MVNVTVKAGMWPPLQDRHRIPDVRIRVFRRALRNFLPWGATHYPYPNAIHHPHPNIRTSEYGYFVGPYKIAYRRAHRTTRARTRTRKQAKIIGVIAGGILVRPNRLFRASRLLPHVVGFRQSSVQIKKSDKRGLITQVETIGDAYMIAGGIIGNLVHPQP